MDISTGICALKFGAVWCAPCKTLEPKLQKMEAEFPNIAFYSVNVDDDPGLAKQYKIRSVPTVILLRDGQEVTRIAGAALINPLRKAFRDLSGSKAA